MSYRAYLVVGLILFLVSILLSFFIPATAKDIRLPFDEMVFYMPLWVLLIYAIIVGPIIEEFVFRSWQKKGQNRRWVAPVLFIIYSLSSESFLLLSIALLFVVAYWIFYRHFYTWHVVLGTTFVFVLLHLPEDYYNGIFYLLIVAYAGLALLLTWFRLRYNLFVAIVVHVLWNFMVTYVWYASDFSWNSKTYELSTATDSIRLTRLSIFDMETALSSAKPGQIDIKRGNKEKIIQALIPSSRDIVVSYNTTPFALYNMYIQSKDGGKIDKLSVLEQVTPILKVSLDSAYAMREGYVLSYDSRKKGKRINDKSLISMNTKHYGSLKAFASTLQDRYQVPIYSEDTTYAEFVYDSMLSLETQKEVLSKEYGIIFSIFEKEMLIITVQDQ